MLWSYYHRSFKLIIFLFNKNHITMLLLAMWPSLWFPPFVNNFSLTLFYHRNCQLSLAFFLLNFSIVFLKPFNILSFLIRIFHLLSNLRMVLFVLIFVLFLLYHFLLLLLFKFHSFSFLYIELLLYLVSWFINIRVFIFILL